MKLRLNANAIITNKEGNVLIIKLKTGPFAGGLCIPGGGIHPGELSRDTIKREIMEETGIRVIGNITPFGFCEMVNKTVDRHRVVLLLYAKGEGELCETDEGIPQWCNPEDISDQCIPFTREALRIWKEEKIHFHLFE